MNKEMYMHAAILMTSVLVSAISQVLLKKASIYKYSSRVREYLNPLVLIAYIMFIGSTFMTILSYQGIPLSMGPIIESTSYIYVTIFGVMIFGEKLNKQRCLGLLCIIIGIIIYSV